MANRDLVAVKVPRTISCVSSGLFSRPYTVPSNQTYEVTYTLTNPHQICSTQKRYRQFRELKDSLPSADLPNFPEKVIFNSRKSAVIEERRGLLQAWLQAILSSPQLKPHLVVFLGVSLEWSNAVTGASEAEQSVLDFLSRVETDPLKKLSTLTMLDMSLFGVKSRIAMETLRRLIDMLMLLCADYMSGCKAIRILSKLLSREWYREHETAQTEWLSLGPDRLRAMGLDLHLLRLMSSDTREEAFSMFKIIYDLWLSQGKSLLLYIVISIQLNDNQEALDLFERWNEGKFANCPVPMEDTSWRKLECGDFSPDICIYFRLMRDYVELKVGIRVKTTTNRVLQCLIDPMHRGRWDKTLIGAQERTMEFNFEVGGSMVLIRLVYELTTQWSNRIIVNFRSKDDSPMMYLSRHELIPGKLPLPGLPRASSKKKQPPELEEMSPMVQAEQEREEGEQYTLLKYYALAAKPFAKAFFSDMLGETSRLQKIFLSLKQYAEETLIEAIRSPCSSFISAVERKSLTPTAVKRSRRALYLATVTLDDQVIDSRLVRRMFQ